MSLIDRSPDPELVHAANGYLHAFGGRDRIRPGQVETYLRWLGNDPMRHPTLTALRAHNFSLEQVAGRPGYRRREPAMIGINRALIAWAKDRRASGDEFRDAHVWMRGLVSTALALDDRRNGTTRHVSSAT